MFGFLTLKETSLPLTHMHLNCWIKNTLINALIYKRREKLKHRLKRKLHRIRNKNVNLNLLFSLIWQLLNQHVTCYRYETNSWSTDLPDELRSSNSKEQKSFLQCHRRNWDWAPQTKHTGRCTGSRETGGTFKWPKEWRQKKATKKNQVRPKQLRISCLCWEQSVDQNRPRLNINQQKMSYFLFNELSLDPSDVAHEPLEGTSPWVEKLWEKYFRTQTGMQAKKIQRSKNWFLGRL